MGAAVTEKDLVSEEEEAPTAETESHSTGWEEN